jgi:hypothetical protein
MIVKFIPQALQNLAPSTARVEQLGQYIFSPKKSSGMFDLAVWEQA